MSHTARTPVWLNNGLVASHDDADSDSWDPTEAFEANSFSSIICWGEQGTERPQPHERGLPGRPLGVGDSCVG